MVELSKKDWEDCKNQAEMMVKQGMIMQEVNNNLLKIAEENMLKFPDAEQELHKGQKKGV